MPRTDRSLGGAHDALRQTPRQRRAPKRPTWSLPATTVARWAVAIVAAIVLFDLVRGWLA